MKSIYVIFALVIVAGCSPSTSSATCDEDESRCPVAKFYCAKTPCVDPCVLEWDCACPADDLTCGPDDIAKRSVCVALDTMPIDDGDPCTTDSCEDGVIRHVNTCQ